MNNDKKSLRKLYKEKREVLFKKGLICKISDKICTHLNEIFENAKNIMLFYPFGSELNILKTMEYNKDKNFYLPKCIGKELVAVPYKTGDRLILNKYNIKEPDTKPISDIAILDIIVTPALCADLNFNRLGYGGGYYDKFFANKKLKAQKIVVIPDEMLVEKLPCEDYDVKCDKIITESKVLF